MKIGMNGRIREIRLALATRLAGAPRLSSGLSRGVEATPGRIDLPDFKQSAYVDLAPTDKADETGVYSEALLYATSNPRVSNIALTGPYGSGKSSIIESFRAKYDRPVLPISLAAFLPEATSESGHVSKQEIERSILQQMLYGADANRLPLSRFKRINTPGKSAIGVSLFILAGMISCWQIVSNITAISSGEYLSPIALSNWTHLAFFGVGLLFLWFAVHYFYVASFGVSLKSISLKDIEITPIAATQESILNRHLDEIIYFFQSTRYDLVVIEDLDRFNNTEIFVTLREINSLINANAGVKRKIRFLYALRDDMFVNTDRTKFFEFIVPVIPIINSSNSIDKVLEQEERLALAGRLDRQFLREVSRYLNDLRLIQNIFNEYAVYIASLETGEDKVLDPNKLLAVLIYKNVFPQDFENLHRGRGALAGILSRHDELIALGESELKDEISELEDLSDRAQRQVPTDMQELARMYAMGLIEKLPALTTRVGVDGAAVTLSNLPRHELFERIIESQRVNYWNMQGVQQSFDIANLQGEIDPKRSYQERKEEIQAKSTQGKTLNSRRVQDLRAKISGLRTAKFNEIVRLNPSAFDAHFDELGEDGRLAKFLVIEGFLDDTYYQYTSLFHKGRLSPNDNNFLIQIRGFSNPQPHFQVDNPKEVIAAMREADFGQAYVLNVRIVDCLLGDPLTYGDETARAIAFISGHFEQSEAFLATYYSTGIEGPALLGKLSEPRQEFVPMALASPNSLEHVANFVARVPSSILQTMPERHPELSKYVSANLPPILALGVDLDPAKLALLNIEVADLSSIESFPGIPRFLFETGLYSLTPENLSFIFGSVLGLQETDALGTQNYTTVLRTDNEALRAKIEKHFPEYFTNVLLNLGRNSQEGVPAIIAAITHEGLDDDDIAAFLGQQTALLPSLDGTPSRLHALIVQLGRIEPVWANCIAFLTSETFDAESLTIYLSQSATLDTLGRQPVPDGDAALELRKFLIEDDSLDEDAYRTYVNLLPKQFRKYPDNISEPKLRILVDSRVVSLSPETFDRLEPYPDLQLLFLAEQIDVYFANAGSYSVDDDFRERLLGSNMAGEHKLAVVLSMDLSTLSGMPSRARAVGETIQAIGADDISMLDEAAARAIILNGTTVAAQIAFFNTFQALFDRDAAREILSHLPRPFSEISLGHHIPVLEMNDQNLELARWLKAKDVISSWSEGWFGGSIRINLFRR